MMMWPLPGDLVTLQKAVWDGDDETYVNGTRYPGSTTEACLLTQPGMGWAVSLALQVVAL